MQNTKWLRIGFFAMLAMAGSATAIACGGDDDDDAGASSSGGDSDGGATSSSSSGGSSTSSGGSSGTSSSSGDSGPAPQKASLFVVHGFNELGTVRICFAGSPDAPPAKNAVPNPIPPLPAAGADGSQPGLLPGTGGFLPDLGTDLSSIFIQPYLVREDKLQGLTVPWSDRTCNKLIGGAAPLLTEGDGYYALDTIPKGALANEKTYALLALNAGTVGTPPAGGDAGSASIKVQLIEVDTETAVDADKSAVQFLHASQYVPPVRPFIYRPATPDAGLSDAGVDDPAKEFFAGANPVAQLAIAPAAAVSTEALNAGTNGFGVSLGPSINVLHTNPETGATIPIQLWAQLSDSKGTQKDDTGTSLYFQPGRSFTFIAVGDIAKPFNPAAQQFQGPHLLVIPNKAAVVQP